MKDLIREYDDYIIGKRDNYSSRFFRQGNKDNEKNALFVMKYAFERYLRLPPAALEQVLDRELMDKMHLYSLMRYLNYPPEYSKSKDFFYVISMIYQQFSLNFRERTIHMYENVVNKRISKYPKEYFLGSEGMVKAGICLQYMLSNHFVSKDLNDLYNLFASKEGKRLLQEEKLNKICEDLFDTPVDYFHFSLGNEESNSFLYMYYKFCYLTGTQNQKLCLQSE